MNSVGEARKPQASAQGGGDTAVFIGLTSPSKCLRRRDAITVVGLASPSIVLKKRELSGVYSAHKPCLLHGDQCARGE